MASQRGVSRRKQGMGNGVKILLIVVVALVVAESYQLFLIGSLLHVTSLQSGIIKSLTSEIGNSTSGSSSTQALQSLPHYNIDSSIPTPPLSLSKYPTITENQTFGSRLTGINSPLNASELAVFNNASNSYFEMAGEMWLNGSINNTVGITPQEVNLFIVNGKPSVIYLGSITCIFCGENRWAMALALGRFGKFDYLFKGYSSFGDGDLPTLYWRPTTYNASEPNTGSFYNSSYINFLPIEDTDPITQGFDLQPIATMQQAINASGNLTYIDAFNYIVQINSFSGTPYTIWGKYVASGADAIDFGNTLPSTTPLPLTNMTHQEVLAQLAKPNDQFAWTEYAAADVYIALMCSSFNSTVTLPSICSIPVMPKLEQKIGVSQ